MRIVFDLFCALLGRGRFAVCATATAAVGALLIVAAPALADSCPNAQFRAGPSATLPDCRAYEWVSPTLDGPRVMVLTFTDAGWPLVTASGDEMAFGAAEPAPGAASSEILDAIVATRSGSGWQDSTVLPAPTQPEAGFDSVGGPLTLSPDLSQAVFNSDQPLVAGAPAGENLYLRKADGGYTLLTDAADDSGLVPGLGFTVVQVPYFAGVSADFTHFFFNPVVAQLAADPVKSGGNLYQWAGGKLSIVNVLPDGSFGQNPAQLVGSPGVSADGDEVLFTQGDNNLYLRIDGDHTVEVNASQRATPDPNSGSSITPLGVTSDGSDVLFEDKAELTENANTGGSDLGNDLYDYNVGTGVLSDLTPDTDAADTNGASVLGVLRMSPDGSYVYFVANGDLAAGATSGQQNFYVEHDGQISYIGDGSQFTGFSAFEVTPDGRYAVFASTAKLTGYDNTDAATGQPDSEVYEYDATTGALTCVSCRPDGTRPTGAATVPSENAVQPGFVSNDGQRVFFESTDQVIPAAGNGLQNVYEWEADGEGSCIRAGGCVFLISPGDTASPAELISASPSGDDVFFDSFDDLAGDQTGQEAVFDARVGGGFPATATPAPSCDSSEICQGAAAATPASPGAGSLGLGGPGDAVTVAAKRTTGKVKVTGKAVKGMAVTLTVRAPGKGRITVTGAKLKRTIKTVSKAGSYRVAVKLSKQAAADWQRTVRRAKAKPRQAKVRERVALKVNFKPATGLSSAVTMSVELKG